MLTLKPTGGLCNRMLAIDSAIQICRETNSPLHIHWVKNHYLNASFFELFEPFMVSDIKITIHETSQKEVLYSDKELPHTKQKIYNWLIKRYQLLHFDQVYHSYETTRMIELGHDFSTEIKNKNVLITSWTRLIPGNLDQTLFIPTSHIQEYISKLTSKFSANNIGVHIRRSDHLDAIANSPTELFIKKMNEEIAVNEDTCFFVASDSLREKQQLKSIFKDRIITSDAEDGDRNSSTGMQMAMIDLYCLSKTKKIYGSFSSTFSSVASELKNADFEEITTKIE
ncbi:MAG: hypothetical protein JXR10_13595 [Cyclobacteriaceae bacterium]